VLTAEGPLQHFISDPRHKLEKTYYAQVEGVVSDSALAALRAGVAVGDYTSQPAQARLVDEPQWLWPRMPPIRFRREIPTAWVELKLREGKNRQVRRMTAAVGLPTLRLIRYAVGIWDLSGLEPGAWRELEGPVVRAPSARAAPRRARTSTVTNKAR
jgi:23S rRNA pseudouridine2457 synthase